MKKFLTIAILLMLAGSTFAQFEEGERITFKSIKPRFGFCTLDSAVAKVFYIPWPTTRWSQQTTLDTVALTTAHPAYQRQELQATGDVFIGVVLEEITAESDSLIAWIKPYWFDTTKESWYESANDSTFLVLDTPGVYAQAGVDYLDWTTAKSYSVQLSNELWSSGGFTLTFKQYTYDNAGASTRVNLSVYFVQ